MFYVYILNSIPNPKKHYTGYTKDLKTRFRQHNAKHHGQTSKYQPWKLSCYFAFEDELTARKFESYLKSGSGRAFAKKHFSDRTQ